MSEGTVPRPLRRAATPPGGLADLLREAFGFVRFRPHQEAVCRTVTEGRDVLLVMPTGAGKSLCYQLPGLARAGTTLVVSPLISLMEDQVAKLQAQGLRAERIHSGRPRLEARRVCADYLEGSLDFLYIAPSCSPGVRPRSWPSTRRTASPNGATISVRTTGCSESGCRSCARRP